MIIEQGKTQTLVNRLSQSNTQAVFASLTIAFEQYLEQYHLSRWGLHRGEDDDSLKLTHPIYIKEMTEPTLGPAHSSQSHMRRVIVDADHVSISREINRDSSMLNQLQVRISEITLQQHLALLTLEVEGQLLFAQISKMSLDNLQLSVGDKVYAQFKAL
mgnify:CR=1 FL=1